MTTRTGRTKTLAGDAQRDEESPFERAPTSSGYPLDPREEEAIERVLNRRERSDDAEQPRTRE